MASELKNMDFKFMVRDAAYRGPTSSFDWNDMFDEIRSDLSSLADAWNNFLVKLTEALPNGSDDSSINAFVYGIDGNHLWVENDVTSASSDKTYYDATNDRPVTVKEAIDDLRAELTSSVDTLNDSVAATAASGGLTDAEKAAIGINIFDSTQISSATSLDGKSENNRLNLLQVAKDLYGPTYALDNDGNANLTNSVQAMVDALLQIHGGNWDDDITVNHAGVANTQQDINSSAPGNDSYAGSPAHLEDDLNQIRTNIKNAKGTAAWTTSLTPLYGGGADSLEDLFVSTAGTGTKTATNPWGYDYTDIDNLQAIQNAIQTFIGQDTSTDSNPLYSGNYIDDNNSLELALHQLDARLHTHRLYGGPGPAPTAEHFADAVETEVVGSGLPNGLPEDSVQDILAWMTGTGTTIAGQQFRRVEVGVSGTGPWSCTHNRGIYPMVSLIQIDPTITTSGQYNYTVDHTDTNNFTMTLLPSGNFLNSGVMLALF